MHILFFIDNLGSGGAQRQIVELAKVFKENDHDVNVLVYHPILFYKKELNNHSIPITIIECKNPFMRLLKIRKYIRDNNFDAVISFLVTPSTIANLSTLPTKKWKLIVGERSSNPNILNRFIPKAQRQLHHFADYVVCNSFANKELVHKANKRLNNDKVKVIYNIVDFDKWTYNGSKDIYNSSDIINIGITASHRYLKNARLLIEALNSLNTDEIERFRVHWYGERIDDSFEENKKLIAKYNLQDTISFYPSIPNVHEKMKDMDVLGLFSTYEGLPNAVCEGMSLGKPIIASNVSDVPYLLEQQKHLIFETNNMLQLIDVLKGLLSMPAKELKSIGEVNKVKAKQLFDKNKIYRTYFKLLK